MLVLLLKYLLIDPFTSLLGLLCHHLLLQFLNPSRCSHSFSQFLNPSRCFCSITSVTVIFFTSLITNFSPQLRTSRSFNFTSSYLMRLSPHTSPTLRYVELQLCTALQFSHCHHRFTSLPAVGTALLPAVGYALASRVLFFFLTGFLGSDPGCFFLDHHSNFHH